MKNQKADFEQKLQQLSVEFDVLMMHNADLKHKHKATEGNLEKNNKIIKNLGEETVQMKERIHNSSSYLDQIKLILDEKTQEKISCGP